MKLKVFTVYDSAVQAFKNPMFFHTKGEALRGWVQAVNDPQLQFGLSPQDYTLFEIGDFDDQTGMLTMYDAKVPLGTALEYVKSNKPMSEVAN